MPSARRGVQNAVTPRQPLLPRHYGSPGAGLLGRRRSLCWPTPGKRAFCSRGNFAKLLTLRTKSAAVNSVCSFRKDRASRGFGSPRGGREVTSPSRSASRLWMPLCDVEGHITSGRSSFWATGFAKTTFPTKGRVRSQPSFFSIW